MNTSWTLYQWIKQNQGISYKEALTELKADNYPLYFELQYNDISDDSILDYKICNIDKNLDYFSELISCTKIEDILRLTVASYVNYHNFCYLTKMFNSYKKDNPNNPYNDFIESILSKEIYDSEELVNYLIDYRDKNGLKVEFVPGEPMETLAMIELAKPSQINDFRRSIIEKAEQVWNTHSDVFIFKNRYKLKKNDYTNYLFEGDCFTLPSELSSYYCSVRLTNANEILLCFKDFLALDTLWDKSDFRTVVDTDYAELKYSYKTNDINRIASDFLNVENLKKDYLKGLLLMYQKSQQGAYTEEHTKDLIYALLPNKNKKGVFDIKDSLVLKDFIYHCIYQLIDFRIINKYQEKLSYFNYSILMNYLEFLRTQKLTYSNKEAYIKDCKTRFGEDTARFLKDYECIKADYYTGILMSIIANLYLRDIIDELHLRVLSTIRYDLMLKDL